MDSLRQYMDSIEQKETILLNVSDRSYFCIQFISSRYIRDALFRNETPVDILPRMIIPVSNLISSSSFLYSNEYLQLLIKENERLEKRQVVYKKKVAEFKNTVHIRGMFILFS